MKSSLITFLYVLLDIILILETILKGLLFLIIKNLKKLEIFGPKPTSPNCSEQCAASVIWRCGDYESQTEVGLPVLSELNKKTCIYTFFLDK